MTPPNLRHGHGRSFEANSLPEVKAPYALAAVARVAGQDDRPSLVESPSQMAVAAPGHMAIIVNFSGLVAACC